MYCRAVYIVLTV